MAVKLALCLVLGGCQDPHRMGLEEDVIDTLNRSILAIEDAGDSSNAAFTDRWISEHQLTFTLSLQTAQRELQWLTRKDNEGQYTHCRFSEGTPAQDEGCRLIEEASAFAKDMRRSGDAIFQQLAWGHLQQAAEAMTQSDAAGANARRRLYEAQTYYVRRLQGEIVRSSDQILRLASLVILILLLFILCGLHFVLRIRRQQQELMERDQTNREYTRKLELIGREVRRLRDLGAAIDATAGVLIFDSQHRVVSINEGFAQLRGIAQSDIHRQSIIGVMGLNDAELVESIITCIAQKKIWRGEIEAQHENGHTLWMYVLFYPELDDLEDFDGSLALVLDITESKRAQLTFDRTRHLTALGEMAGGIAHEINNPLSVITGRVAVLLKKFHAQQLDPGMLQSGLEQIQRTVSRIARIVDSMRRLSRADVSTETLRAERLETVLRESMEFIEDKLKKYDVAFRIQDPFAISDIQVMLQGFGISQILINLISNAVDAIDSTLEGERWIRVELGRSDQGMVQIKVLDSGQGIPKAIQNKIMDPFFTTKPAGKGTGLGLSLSQRIAEEHGGRLYLEGEAAHTTFILELPEIKRERDVA